MVLLFCIALQQMDRTSILGDTIDYTKELLEKIKSLQQEIEAADSNELNMAHIFKDVKPNEILLRNTPKVLDFFFFISAPLIISNAPNPELNCYNLFLAV